MLIYEILLTEATVGREWQHLEDLVFVDGSAGAKKASQLLKSMGKGSTDLNVKWDGRIAIIWGREPDGTFVCVGKNYWDKGNKFTSAEELENAIASAGKGEEWRAQLASDMGAIFDILKRSTDESFRGYVLGDLLWHPGQPVESTAEGLQFTPNKVLYTVNPDSDLGKRVSASKVGIAAHVYYKEFGDTDSTPITGGVDGLNSSEAVVLNSEVKSYSTKIDTSHVSEIDAMISKYGNQIDALLEKRKGLSDLKNIIYTYVNQMSRAGKLDDLAVGFGEWLANSKVSDPKKDRIMNLPEIDVLPHLFQLILKIQAVKDDIIDQIDDQEVDIKATTAGQKGGEGYASNSERVKLVPRKRWTP